MHHVSVMFAWAALGNDGARRRFPSDIANVFCSSAALRITTDNYEVGAFHRSKVWWRERFPAAKRVAPSLFVRALRDKRAQRI